MNVNNTIKVDVATNVKIPLEVIIANAEQVFSCTIGRPFIGRPFIVSLTFLFRQNNTCIFLFKS